ncbi:hypothetical protein [Paraglaciecola sp. 25GB23A]|uniref:hypothetical protein n=1 Tax=Paraglaciecola sp. 25GB23A TaxID=3156068 RepID=UPI0032AFB68F
MSDHKIKLNPIPAKEELCIWALLRAQNSGLFQLEASNDYGETCLHSSISTLQNRHNIFLARESKPHTHRHGGTTRFTHYRLMDDVAKQRAVNRLNYLRSKRGYAPLLGILPTHLPYSMV